MKNNKVLALALSAGLVVTGFNTAHAADAQPDDFFGSDGNVIVDTEGTDFVKENLPEPSVDPLEGGTVDLDSEGNTDGYEELEEFELPEDENGLVDKLLTPDGETEDYIGRTDNDANDIFEGGTVDLDPTGNDYPELDSFELPEDENGLVDKLLTPDKETEDYIGKTDKELTSEELFGKGSEDKDDSVEEKFDLEKAKEDLHNIIREANDEGFISLSQALEFESELDAATTEAEIENLFGRVTSATKREALDSLEAHKEAAAAIINDLYDQGKISLADSIDYTLEIKAAKDEAAVEEILNQIFAEKPELEEDDDLEVEKIKASNSIKWLNDNGFISIAQALEFEAEIDKATTKAQLDEIVEKAMNTRSDLLTDLSKTQLAADDIIDDLRRSGRITDEQARGFYDRIDQAKTSEEIQKILKDAFAIRNKKSIPWTDLTPAKPIDDEWVFPFPLPFPNDDEVPGPVKPSPADPTPAPSVDPVEPTEDEPSEDDKKEDTTSKEIDDLIKEIDDRDQEIRDELERIDSTVVVDDNKKPADEDKKPADEDKKPVETDKEDKEDDAKAQPSKDKVVVKEIIKDVKEAVRVPAASHNNPKTGVADLSAVAGTLAISMAGIVATRKKND